MICGSGGSKSRLAKAAGAEPASQMHAVVARSTFPSQNVQNKHTNVGPLLEVEMSKKCTPLWGTFASEKAKNTSPSEHSGGLRCQKCTRLWPEAHFQVKMYKAPQLWNTFGSWDVEKVHAVVARSTVRSQNVQITPFSEHFWKLRCWKVHAVAARSTCPSQNCKKTDGYGALLDVQMSFCVAGARDCAPCQKWAKCDGFVALPKALAGVGHLKRIRKDAFRVAGAVHETWRSGHWFPERGLHFGAADLQVCCYDFAWQAQHFVWSGTNFSWQAQHIRQMEWKNRKNTHCHEAVSSALNFPCLKDISQNCFVFDVVSFENWGSLAELSPFWCCQVQSEEVSQNCFVFKLADLQVDR